MSAPRDYQYGYSALHPEVTDPASRERKAVTAISVIKEVTDRSVDGAEVLDVGGSSGVMAECFAREGARVTAIDIDDAAIAVARERVTAERVTFEVADAMNLDYPDASMDIVLCCHVYEHVPDAGRMMDEIYRVLRPGGWCYFAAGNRFAWREPHYDLPLLSVIPRPLAHWYLRALGRGSYYHEVHLSYWGLKQLTRRFERKDMTEALIIEPEKYGTGYMVRPGSVVQAIAKSVVRWLPALVPGYIWMLGKPD